MWAKMQAQEGLSRCLFLISPSPNRIAPGPLGIPQGGPGPLVPCQSLWEFRVSGYT